MQTSCKMSLSIDSYYVPTYASKKHEERHEGFQRATLGTTLFESMSKYVKNNFQYIADTGEVETYEQVLRKCIRTALKLKEERITRTDIISTCTHNQKNSVVPLIATLFLGAKPANFDPNLSHLEITHLLKLMQPKIIFIDTQSLPLMERCLRGSNTDAKLVVFGNSEKYCNFSEYLKPHPEEADFRPGKVEDNKETALILFSSGTTGLPKGICLSHYCLLTRANDPAQFPPGNREGQAVTLVYTTFYWVSAVFYLIKSIIGGHARVVCSKFDGSKAWEYIEKYKVTATFLAPHLAVELLLNRRKDVDTRSLRFMIIGGSRITKEFMIELREALPYTNVVNGYGQTEAGSCITVFNMEKPEEMEMQVRKPTSCGKMTHGYLWKVIDPSTEEKLGPNRKGELRIKSDFLMNGYYKMDSSSVYDSEGYLKTGDIVYYDEEECFYIEDRIKEMFKYRGWHILPAIIEKVLLTHPAVKEAVVIGIPHGTDGDYPMGIVVLQKGYDDVTSEELEKFVEERVPDTQRLRAGVKIVDDVVRTATGKVARQTMKTMVLDGRI